MELRHLRCFIVLAEELHFTRAAERLHIEQSPLSRTIKELEDELGVLLFTRDRRGTRLTQAGAVFLQDVRRVFTTLEQARENARAGSAGYRGSLRIAVSDGAVDPRLSAFLARCREATTSTSEAGLRSRPGTITKADRNNWLSQVRTFSATDGAPRFSMRPTTSRRSARVMSWIHRLRSAGRMSLSKVRGICERVVCRPFLSRPCWRNLYHFS